MQTVHKDRNMRVNFMIIGAQKSGTTSLASHLTSHPEVAFSNVKEPGYFNRNQAWESGLGKYHDLFAPKNGQICGEGSTMYTFIPEWIGTHERLYAYNSNLKLIYIMRNPIERVISNYAHRLVRGTEKNPPEIAVFADPTYISRSRYAVQLRPYLELFGRKNIHLMIFEDYIADPVSSMAVLAGFLRISPIRFQPLAREGHHQSVGEWYLRGLFRRIARVRPVGSILSKVPQGTKKLLRPLLSRRLEHIPRFPPELKETLWRLIEDDVNGIEVIMGRKLDLWRNAI